MDITSKVLFLLGKNGDICGCLPIAKHIADKTGKPTPWIVSQQYQLALGGASYVEPVPVHYQFPDTLRALEWAKTEYANIVFCQAFGRHWTGGKTGSYNLQCWLSAGMTIEQFNDSVNFPLVFDNRNAERERFVTVRAVQSENKPILLTHIACSKSSPFSSHYIFTESLKRKWSHHFEIINLCDVKCAAVYDLLGLFERAKILITGDGVALHLATAVPTLPVIALVNDTPWLATTPRCNVAFKTTYSKWHEDMKEIHAAIRRHL